MSGAVKDKPIWYDVYQMYPPDVEPMGERDPPPQDPIPEIVYEEDFERASASKTKYKTQKEKTQVRTRAKPEVGLMKKILQEI